MKVSGFTFVRNAIKFDYPIVEAIRSILPLCEEVVVAVGKSEDGTLELIRNIGDPKIRIVETVWDDSLREGGKVLAAETDKALNQVSKDADWCLYIQGDEVLHERDHALIRSEMEKYLPQKEVEGLLFRYVHFYGSYGYTADSRKWYRREVRIIRNDPRIRSWRDAQGFRKKGEKLQVREIDATVYHYGWVKPPAQQQLKQEHFNKLWHPDAWVRRHITKSETFDYQGIESLTRFSGTHPVFMEQRVREQPWKFEFDPSGKKLPLKEKFSRWLEKRTGHRFGEYKNFREI